MLCLQGVMGEESLHTRAAEAAGGQLSVTRRASWKRWVGSSSLGRTRAQKSSLASAHQGWVGRELGWGLGGDPALQGPVAATPGVF